jgi:hypothetical protein
MWKTYIHFVEEKETYWLLNQVVHTVTTKLLIIISFQQIFSFCAEETRVCNKWGSMPIRCTKSLTTYLKACVLQTCFHCRCENVCGPYIHNPGLERLQHWTHQLCLLGTCVLAVTELVGQWWQETEWVGMTARQFLCFYVVITSKSSLKADCRSRNFLSFTEP